MIWQRLLRKRSLKILNLSDLDQGQWMTLTFDTQKASCTYLVDCIYQLLYHRLQKFLKESIALPFSHTKALSDKIWPCHKIGQGHHLNRLGSTRVPNAAYQLSRSSAFWFRRRWFFGGFYHIWAWRPTRSRDLDHLIKFLFLHPRWKLHIKFGFNQPSTF